MGVDVFAREVLAVEAEARLSGENVVGALNRPVWLREHSEVVFCDKGADFTSQIVDLWAYHLKIWMESSRPETPTNNAHIKPFNGTPLDEFLT